MVVLGGLKFILFEVPLYSGYHTADCKVLYSNNPEINNNHSRLEECVCFKPVLSYKSFFSGVLSCPPIIMGGHDA